LPNSGIHHLNSIFLTFSNFEYSDRTTVNPSRVMTKKNILLIVLVLFLACLSLYLNRDRFRSDPIQISVRSVPPRDWMLRQGNHPQVNPVIFLLTRQARLTSVKVVLDSEMATNKYPHAVWELVSASHSIPVKDFIYGMNINGMKPAVQGVTPEPLEPGVKYHVFAEAGSHKMDCDFVPVPSSR
jgi:hypothetical protein